MDKVGDTLVYSLLLFGFGIGNDRYNYLPLIVSSQQKHGGTSMKHAAIYVNAKGNHPDQSATQQIDICREYALQNGIEIIGTYTDITKPDMPVDRTSLKALFKDSRKRSFDTVLISDFDRLATNLADLLIYHYKLKIKGIDVISVTGFDTDTKPMSLLNFLTDIFNKGGNL